MTPETPAKVTATTLPDEPLIWEVEIKESVTGLTVLVVPKSAYDALLQSFNAERLRAEAAKAEVARLNSWADSFTDQHLKERQTGDALVKECMQRAEAAEARAEKAEAVVKLADELCTAVDNASEDIGGTRPIATILAELGPAVDTAIEQGAQHG